MFGGWEWNGAATSGGSAATWRIRSDSKKMRKLGRADAAERHLVVVLDPRTTAGLRIPLGLVDWKMPGALAGLLPVFAPPEPLTGIWLVPSSAEGLGLAWRRGLGWAILQSQDNTWVMTVDEWPPPASVPHHLGNGAQG